MLLKKMKLNKLLLCLAAQHGPVDARRARLPRSRPQPGPGPGFLFPAWAESGPRAGPAAVDRPPVDLGRSKPPAGGLPPKP